MVDTERRKVSINGYQVEIAKIQGVVTEYNPKLTKKLYNRQELAKLCEIWREHGVRIAFTTGVYDMIHVGHVRYLELARSLGDILIVGLNSDKSVRALKGPGRPILDEHKRAEMLAYLSAVNYISIFNETTGAELISAINPHAYLCVEGSWEGELETKSEVVAMAYHGGEVYYTPRQHPNVSTTRILEEIENSAVERFREAIENE